MSSSEEYSPPWLFDEYRDAEWQNAAVAAAYEKTIGTDAAAERELLRSLALAIGHTLIDFGAGTGVLALEAATMCRRVIAVDVSAAMLDYMHRKATARGIRNIEYVQQGFLTYHHEGELADFAVTRHVLHHLPDFWKVEALRRVFDVLKPGGIFHIRELVYSFEPEDATGAIERWFATVPADANALFSRAFFEEHVREKYSTYSWLFEEMLRKVGFEIESTSYSEVQAHARYLCVKPR
jgi:ubiquinone/menaquinone biosynthesis C-methylase UbiE